MLEALQRRLRKLLKTSDVNALVEELLVGLGDDAPAEFPNGIVLTMDGTEPPITVRNWSEDEPWATFQPHGKTLPDFNFNLTLDANGNIPETSGSGGGGGGTSAVSVFSGVVASGSGDSYVVTLSTGASVNVTQLQIDASETIPAGTAVVVNKRANNTYFMQVPVYL